MNLGGTAGSSLTIVTITSPISSAGFVFLMLNFQDPGSLHETVTSAGATPFTVSLNSAALTVVAKRSADDKISIVFMS